MAPPQAELAQKRLQAWRTTIDRYESEPATNEGRKELTVRAKTAEAVREHALAVDNMMDAAAAALQLSIVLASTSVVIGIVWLAWAGGALALIGFAFALLGWFAPTLLTPVTSQRLAAASPMTTLDSPALLSLNSSRISSCLWSSPLGW